MNKCTECGSYAINHHCHGRDGSDPELCDVCYWRVRATDYATLEAEREMLRQQVAALQSDANSWQSGYDKGREDGAKAADGWKAQHARDSAELRRLCAERDHLKACQENAQLHITGLVAERNATLRQRDKLAWVLREKFPRIDPHTPVPLNELDHCCEYVLYQERERLHKVIDAALSELTP